MEPSASVQRMQQTIASLRASMPEGEAASPPPGALRKQPTFTGASMRSSIGRSPGTRDGASGAHTDAAQLANDYEVVRHRYEEVLKENETLKVEQKRRLESYMRREATYKEEVRDLKAEVERQRADKPVEEEEYMSRVRSQHKQVMSKIREIKSNETKSLQDQEKDLLRAFRARLWDVQFELETERSKKDDGALEWIEKTRTLGKELDWARDEALRLDRLNQVRAPRP